MLSSSKREIESTIWHELGHAFFVVLSDYNLKEIEFSERGAIVNGEKIMTFGVITDFEFPIKNSELYLLANRKHFILRILNILSGSIFEGLYLKEDPISLLEKGRTHPNSDYSILNERIKNFNKENGTDIERKVNDYFKQLYLAFLNDDELITNLTELTKFIQEGWSKEAFNRIEITHKKLEIIKGKLKDLVSSITLSTISEIVKNFETSY